MADLGVIERVGTVFSAEATSNTGIEIAYPGISTWKITAIGQTAHPTEPEQGINAVTKMAKLVAGGRRGPAGAAEGRLAVVRAAGDHATPSARCPAAAGRSPARCDAVLSVLSPAGTNLTEVRDAIDAFLRELEQEDGEVRFERKILPMGAGRLWLRPGECDPEPRGRQGARGRRSRRSRGEAGEVRKFNGGWVDAVELMRPDARRLRRAGDDHVRPRRLRAGPHGRRAHPDRRGGRRPPRSTRGRPARCWAEGNEGEERHDYEDHERPGRSEREALKRRHGTEERVVRRGGIRGLRAGARVRGVRPGGREAREGARRR